MRKIPSLFERDWQRDIPAQPQVSSGCEWVLDPHVPVVPTLKYDGTSCLIWRGSFYRRRTVEIPQEAPTDFVSDAQLRGLPNLLDVPDVHGWVPIEPGRPADRYHVEGLQEVSQKGLPPDGTYELVGPKIQNNPYELNAHTLWRHGREIVGSFFDGPLSFAAIQARLEALDGEGVVFHELHGPRAAKVKRSDFGLSWPR